MMLALLASIERAIRSASKYPSQGLQLFEYKISLTLKAVCFVMAMPCQYFRLILAQ